MEWQACTNATNKNWTDKNRRERKIIGCSYRNCRYWSSFTLLCWYDNTWNRHFFFRNSAVRSYLFSVDWKISHKHKNRRSNRNLFGKAITKGRLYYSYWSTTKSILGINWIINNSTSNWQWNTVRKQSFTRLFKSKFPKCSKRRY